MLQTLSLVEWEIRSVLSCTAAFCGATHTAVGHREEGVVRPSANSGCVKIASAMSVANEHPLDRVRHFVESLAILAFEWGYYKSGEFGLRNTSGNSRSKTVPQWFKRRADQAVFSRDSYTDYPTAEAATAA